MCGIIQTMSCEKAWPFTVGAEEIDSYANFPYVFMTFDIILSGFGCICNKEIIKLENSVSTL